jgi:hypothetical protein
MFHMKFMWFSNEFSHFWIKRKFHYMALDFFSMERFNSLK